jgi:hypothetical protein
MMALPPRDDMERLFFHATEKARAWILDNVFCMLDRLSNDVEVRFLLHQYQQGTSQQFVPQERMEEVMNIENRAS